MGHPEHRLRLRSEGEPGPAGAEVAGGTPDVRPSARLPLDGSLVPALLLLVARDVLLYDPHRVLAWRLLHEPSLAAVPGWLAPLLPRPSGGFDRDPVALLLGTIATAAALLYLVAAVAGYRARVRAVILGAAAVLLVVAPTLAFVAMGFTTGRPYGQDGGVVQLPLALDLIREGRTPYGADYSRSMLGRQARVSEFWADHGGNPILRHHAYLPGTHLLMLPFHMALRPFGLFDPRLVTLLAYAAATVLAARVVGGAGGASRGLAAAALVAVNPLVYWHQIFGANDLLLVALLLLALWLGDRGRPLAAAAAVGLACASKQLAWPFAPFVAVHLSGVRSFGELFTAPGLSRLARPVGVMAAVCLAVVGPLAALDPRAFWGDIVAYNVGLAGADAYPLGGTPGIGFANLLVYAGRVASLREHVSFAGFYLLLAPVGVLLLRRQMRLGGAWAAVAAGAAALVASLYFSRVFHPNYLVLAAVLLPLAVLAPQRRGDLAAVPLLLLAVAVEIAENEVLRAVWEDAHGEGGLAVLGPLAPLAAPALSRDPLGLGLSGVLSGLAVLYLVIAFLGAREGVRRALAAVGFAAAVAVPTLVIVAAGMRGGVPVRAQDPWLAQVLAGGRAERVVAQAWSPSFRRDPPAPLNAADGPPGAAALGAAAAPLGGDPRWLLLVAGAGLGGLVAWLVPPVHVPVAWAGTLLSPAAAIGVVFGSPALLVACGVVAAATLAAGRRTLAAALVLGALAACVPWAVFAAPFVLLGRPDASIGRALTGLAAGFVLLAALGAASGVPVTLAGLLPSRLEPGVGFGNALIYAGAEASPLTRALGWLPPLLWLALGALAWRCRGALEPLAASAAALLAGALVAGRFSPLDLAAPVVLLVLCAFTGADRGRSDRAPRTVGSADTGRKPVTDDLAGRGSLLRGAGSDRLGLVPEAGLEPAWVSPHAPQTCVSANSTTPARVRWVRNRF